MSKIYNYIVVWLLDSTETPGEYYCLEHAGIQFVPTSLKPQRESIGTFSELCKSLFETGSQFLMRVQFISLLLPRLRCSCLTFKAAGSIKRGYYN